MELSVKGWMKDLVVFVEPEATVMEALSLMRHRYVNSLIAKTIIKVKSRQWWEKNCAFVVRARNIHTVLRIKK